MKTSGSQARVLKVQNKLFARKKFRYVFFPEICLTGKWLQDCGFQIGQHVEVVTENNKIIISLAWPDSEI